MESFVGSGDRSIYSLTGAESSAVESDLCRVRNLLVLVRSRKERLEKSVERLEMLRKSEAGSLKAFSARKTGDFEDLFVGLGCELSELLLSFDALKKAVSASSEGGCLENPFFFEMNRLEKEVVDLKRRANRFLTYSFL